MEIRTVDPDVDADVEAFARISAEAETADNPYPTPFTAPELRESLRNLDPTDEVKGFLGVDGDRPVAAGMLDWPTTANLDKTYLSVTVAPDDRGRGYGSRLAEFLVGQALQNGRTTLLTEVVYPFDAAESHPARRFAQRHGFSLSQATVHRVLHLPPDEALLDRLEAEATPHARDFELRDFTGLPPEEILDDYCVLLNTLMTDAPSGSVQFEEGKVTPAALAERYGVLDRQRRTAYTTIAFDRAGVPVAHSQLVVPEHDPGKIFQWDTLVRRDARGHRLGMLTKVRNLRRVARLHPDRQIVHTWNAESNRHMIAVNEALGFEPVTYIGEYVRHLEAPRLAS